MKATHWILRTLVIFILVTTAVGKFIDLTGFKEILMTYRVIPVWLLWPLAIGVPLFELILGAILIWDKRQIGLYFAIGFHVFYTVWTYSIFRLGIEVPNCGCFGVFFARPLTFNTVIEDLVMVLICVGASLTQKHAFKMN